MIPAKSHFSSVFAIAALAVMVITAAVLIYLTLVERPYLSYPNLPIPVEKKAVYIGDVLPLRVTRCNSSKERKVFTSARLLENLGEDQEVIVMELIAQAAAPGCKTTLTTVHRIPEATQPGEYRLQGVATIPGVIRNFYIDWYTEPFRVVARPGVAGVGPQGPPGVRGLAGPRGIPGPPGKDKP